MYKLWTLASLALLAAGPLASTATAATTVLDQGHVATGDGINFASSTVNGTRRVQTVTAGMTGTLSEVHIQMFPTTFNGFDYSAAFVANVTGFNVVNTNSGTPETALSAILGTGTFAGLQGDWAVFTTSLAITAGQVFGIEPVTSAFAASWHFGGFYGGGRDYFLSGGSFQPQQTGQSGGFRTFVDISPVSGGAVPEPASWAMLIAGFGLVGAAARRRRAQALIGTLQG
ncbi:PEPxxWA-CTERM sorting domain-containing protein [Sandarakinorhabdus sp.]|uniref:PEPxxWA-CTERM sorting domain-containing protein n=1 Tax=Sandarakinorhabdus sp. TaxID=1916663 RepID=UPI003F719333